MLEYMDQVQAKRTGVSDSQQGLDPDVLNNVSATAVAAMMKSNLFFGTGLLSDKNEVRLIDMADIDGSQNFRLIMRLSAGIQYGIGSDIVYYGA